MQCSNDYLDIDKKAQYFFKLEIFPTCSCLLRRLYYTPPSQLNKVNRKDVDNLRLKN